MKVARGDVVLVDFPFASNAGQKLRPAVVVQSDAYNRRLAITILAPVTTNTRHTGDASQVVVDPTTADGLATGLLRPSAIKSENLATVETRLVRRKIGELSLRLCAELDSAIKASLGLT